MKLGHLVLDGPAVMGILNVTPDSFSDGGRFADRDAALQQAEAMVTGGAQIIDVGGESTRPGAQDVGDAEEADRVVPVIEAIKQSFDIAVSVDTSKASVMREAANAGAALINDVRALREHGALEAASESGLAVCLMHMQGQPRTMQKDPQYDDVVSDIRNFLADRIAACEGAGIPKDRIIVDPGFGFGKTPAHNVEILARLGEFRDLGCPILAGLSRKSTLGELTGKPVEERLAASVAAAVLAVTNGAEIVRVHDVTETVDAIRVTQAVLRAGRA